MALKPPGSRSNIQLLITGFWASAMLLILLGGHIIAGYLILASFLDGDGMKNVTKFTGLHDWMIWVWILAGIGLDGWIFHNIRKDRKKALER